MTGLLGIWNQSPFEKIKGFLQKMLDFLFILSSWQRLFSIGRVKEEVYALQGHLVFKLLQLWQKSKLSKSLSERDPLSLSCCTECQKPPAVLMSRALASAAAECFTVFLHMHVVSDGRSTASRWRSRVENKVRPAEKRIKTQQRENDRSCEAKAKVFFFSSLFLSLPLSRDEH